MTKKQICLSKVFSLAVDGGCSNAYRIILNEFERMPIEMKKVEITFNDIYEALKPVSKKWEKEIEEVVG